MIPFRAVPVDCNPQVGDSIAPTWKLVHHKVFLSHPPGLEGTYHDDRPIECVALSALLSLPGKHLGHNGPVEYVRRVRVGVGHVFSDHIVAHSKERRQPGRFGIGLQFDSLQTGRADRGAAQFAAASQQSRPTSIAAAARSQAALPMQNPLRAQYRRPADGDGHFQSHRTR
jgi:hypothetical protein